MIPGNQRLTFVVVGSTSGLLPSTVQGVREDVLSELSANFLVHDVTINRQDTPFGPSALYWNWRYDATVSVTTKVAYAKIEDVDSVVAHAFAEGTGEVPTVTANGFEPSQGPGATGGWDWAKWLTGGGVVVGLAALAVVVVAVKVK